MKAKGITLSAGFSVWLPRNEWKERYNNAIGLLSKNVLNFN